MKKRMLTLLSAVTVMLTILVSSVLPAGAFLVGDVADNDGAVTAADARLVLRASVGLETLSDELKAIADTDENGSITASDARTILRMSVNLDPQKHYFTKKITLAPTCTEKGSMTLNCTECDEVKTAELDALGHAFGNPEILVAVTCETDGTEKYTCTREGCTYSEERTVTAGHTPDIPAATCTAAQNCTRGNHVMTAALGHKTEWGTCTQCNTFITTKYAAQAETIKTKFNEASAEAKTAYSYIQNSVGAASWLTNYAASSKPYYEKALAAYQAAYDACAAAPELSTIKAKLEKNITNTKGILAQLTVIANAGFVDSSNYFALVDPIDNLNYINSDSIIDTDKAIKKLIKW